LPEKSSEKVRSFYGGFEMIGKLTRVAVLLAVALSVVLVSAQMYGQTPRKQMATAFNEPATPQQPLFTDYKGVRLGMTPAEVQARFGQSGIRNDDQEFYIFNERETAQVVYDATNRVMVISVDYLGGVGAPDFKTVVGPDITVRPDGSMYKIVRYEHLGFWVSYNRTANTGVPMVSITIQKSLR
jgi:hypothetical protein